MLLKILQNSKEKICAEVSFVLFFFSFNFIEKDNLAKVFSYEFCKISSKNTYFAEHLRITNSVNQGFLLFLRCLSFIYVYLLFAIFEFNETVSQNSTFMMYQ